MHFIKRLFLFYRLRKNCIRTKDLFDLVESQKTLEKLPRSTFSLDTYYHREVEKK